MACTGALFVPRTEVYSSQQADQFRQLRTDSQWTDVTIHSQGTTFQCHRVILAATSPVLKAMMLTDMAESKERTIALDRIPPSTLELLINYIYEGEVYVPCDELLCVAYAADYLQLAELKQCCLGHALSTLAPSNVISWYKLAEQLGAKELKVKCSEMLASALSDVCKEPEFLELSPEEMSSYMHDAKEAEVDCDDLLDATFSWVDHKADSRQSNLIDLIQNINISRCSIQCLEEVVDRYTTLLHSQPGVWVILTKGMAEAAKQTSVKIKRNKTGRKKSVIAVVGGHVYHAGKYVANSVFWYIGNSMQFEDLCKEEEFAFGLSVCAIPDGFIVTGGDKSVICTMFVSATRSWKKLTDLTISRRWHGSVFRNGRIYVFGGLVSGIWSASVHSLDLSGGDWQDESGLPVGVESPEVVCMDGSIFLLMVISGALLRLDMGSRPWKEESQRPGGGCYGARMTVVHNQIMILGGENRLFDCYDPGTKRWTTRNVPSLKHYFSAVVFHEEKLFLIGGKEEDRVEEYNLASESWTVCDYRVPTKLYNLHAVVLNS